MAATVKQTEAIPLSYPAKPSGLTTNAAAIDSAIIWQRIEAYIARRFTTREVVWIVEDCGEWVPPLSPATVTATEVWESDAWASFTPTPGPCGGFIFKGHGPYRVTANVGGGDVPALADEAYRRLAEYLAGVETYTGLREDRTEGIGGAVYDATAVAKAIQNSGAGDLLRSFRRAA